MTLEGMTLVIEQYKTSKGYKTYIEAIVDFAAENDIEVEEIVDHIHPNLKKKIEIEFKKHNFIPGQKIDNSMDDFLEQSR